MILRQCSIANRTPNGASQQKFNSSNAAGYQNILHSFIVTSNHKTYCIMERRDFIKNSSLAVPIVIGTITSAAVVASCNAPVKEEKKEPAKTPGSKAADVVLNEITIDGMQQKMQSGEYTSRSITQLYLDRIDAIDKKGPAINAVIEINPGALSIADEMDKERKSGKLRGPLHGIPVLIKDNINTGDKMMTTASALALLGNKAAKEAFIIKQLREAVAELLGKTNLREFANCISTKSSSQWRNAWM